MKLYGYRLIFDTPLHLGLEGIGAEKIEETLHSDTLWGALVSSYFQLFDVADKDEFCLNPPFRVSSGFPFFGDTLFLPVPLGALDPLFDRLTPEEIKILKKVKYLALPLFEQIIAGVSATELEYRIHGYYMWPKNEPPESVIFSRTSETPRISLDRRNDTVIEGEFFYFSQMYFSDKAGFYFLAHFDAPESQQKMEAALRLLGDEGLGADRTVGRGFFHFERQEINLKVPDTGSHFITLSLYHPTTAEVEAGLLKDSAYDLINRRGYAAHLSVRGKRRKSIRMFTEGSCFTAVNGPEYPGDISVVLKKSGSFIPFNVYRYGKAFPIPYRRSTP